MPDPLQLHKGEFAKNFDRRIDRLHIPNFQVKLLFFEFVKALKFHIFSTLIFHLYSKNLNNFLTCTYLTTKSQEEVYLAQKY